MPSDREPAFVPFADDDTAITMGDFNVENGTERIAVFGSLDITRDAAGLRKAQTLRDLMDDIIRQIESGAAVPPAAPGANVKSTPNPFGDGD